MSHNKKKKPVDSPSPHSATRGIFSLLLIIAIFLFVGSYFIRAEVIRRVQQRTSESHSVVLGAPLAIIPGTNINKIKLQDRLYRLGYQKITSLPERGGQYTVSPQSVLIHLRETRLPRGNLQPDQLVRFALDQSGTVTAIENTKFGDPINQIWLEPEVISLLSSSSSRASIPQPLESFPKRLVDAVLAIEDERFYYHFGIDPIAITRALIANFRQNTIVQGGSTITQQLAKNMFFSPQRSFLRKGFEAIAAVLMETAFTKKQILEFYLNEVFLAQDGPVAIHGFAEASRALFGKDVSDISLGEAATLAGIIKGPSRYSPRKNPQLARKRRNIVLEQMRDAGKITEKEAQKAGEEEIKVINVRHTRRVAPYFVDYLRKQLPDLTSVSYTDMEQGLQLHTGLDREYQRCAETALSQGLQQLERTYSALRRKNSPLQGVLLAIEPASGEIRAWVGGRDYGQNQFDRVSLAIRQPGSAFKPFVYLTGLDPKLNSYRVARTTSLLEDMPLKIEVPGSDIWEPSNYDRKFLGEVTVREALTNSLNIPTVNLALKVGIKNIARTAEILGLGYKLDPVPSLALGAVEVTPLALTRAYSTLANGGVLVNPRPLISVTSTTSDRPLITFPLREERVSSEPAIFILTDILRGVVERGTGAGIRRQGFKAPVAGKTGTSNDTRDAWFVGFTPHLLTTTWVGFDDGKKLGLTGGQAAVPIWTEFMKCVEPMEPALDFISPPGVVTKQIDRQSGLLPTAYCPKSNLVSEIFIEGTEPITPCPLHHEGSWLKREEVRTPQQRPLPNKPSRGGNKPKLWDQLWEGLMEAREE